MMDKIISAIKSMFNFFGIEVKKFSPVNYNWLQEYKISAVLDIGANTGQYANKINTILPGVKIYSFEPIKRCYKELLENSSVLNLTAFNFALGEKEYETTINISSHSPSSSILEMANLHLDLFANTDYKTEEKIHVKTLDNVAPELNISDKNYLVKIDVQGFEDKVITGGRDTIENAKVVQVEMTYQELYKGQLLFDDIYKMLLDLGFVFSGNISQVYNPSNGSLIYSDSIFVKKQ